MLVSVNYEMKNVFIFEVKLGLKSPLIPLTSKN